MQNTTLHIAPHDIVVYENDGSGPPIVFIHGNSGAGSIFSKQFEGVLATHKIVSFDFPGHGGSSRASKPAEVYTLRGFADVLVKLVQAKNLQKAVFVGLSLGGHILLEATAQLTEAAGFVIHGTPPIAFPPAMQEAFLPHPSAAVNFKPDLNEEEKQLFLSGQFKPGTETFPDTYKNALEQTDPITRSSVAAGLGPGTYADEIEVVGHLTQPLAVLHGEHDQLINLEYIKKLSMPTLWREEVHAGRLACLR